MAMRPRGTGYPSVFGSERSFSPPVGSFIGAPGELRGYHIDFSVKAQSPEWPPPSAIGPGRLHVTAAQWGLGAYERHLAGEGETWLGAARAAAEHLVSIQDADGGWSHHEPMPHTFRLDPPWLSAMAQGEGASLLIRVHGETGDERFVKAARLALAPMRVPSSSGGVLASLDGVPILEEYPTDPPSFVLNGAIFALWGVYDVGCGLDDDETLAEFSELARALATRIDRYDVGYWSRYDLYPRRIPNVASPAYHLLHINQLTALDRIFPSAELRGAAERFQRYRRSRMRRLRALGAKVAFRLLVPRNRLLARLGR
jgi:heparosan-N-sulfate-glucuronate 5-epimerase